MNKPFLDKLRKIDPYVPGEQPKTANVIKLNANENPYPPAPGVTEVLRTFDAAKLAVYPDANAKALKTALAEREGLKPSQVFLGNGSDDVLALAFQSFFCSGEPILYPDITYSFYPVWCDLLRIPYETVPLDENFCINLRDYDKPNGGVILPNPNAPTGLLLSLENVEDIIRHNQDVVVIVDEAYIDFGGKSALELTAKYENLLVVQTFSKSRSMAGMRIGFAIGHPDLIKALNDVKYSYNSYTMNMPSLILGTETVKDDAYFRETVQKIIDTREWSKTRLTELGFTFPDSMSNFIFASHNRVPAKELFEALKQQQIYVRYFDQPRLSNYLRISIGTREEMEELFAFLEKYLAE